MKMGHYKVGIMQQVVNRTIGYNKTGESPKGKVEYKPHYEEQGRRIVEAARPKGSQSVQYLYRRRNGNNGSSQCKVQFGVNVESNGKHVVPPIQYNLGGQ